MKAKKYRLETVLDIRRRAKDEAAQIVALRFQQLEQAEAELSRRRMLLQACYEQQDQAQKKMYEELDKGIRVQNVVVHKEFLSDLKNKEAELQADVDKQIQAVARAEKEVEKARESLIESARELKSIETHKSNWQTAVRVEENRREQKISDEIGAILHGRNKKVD